jgi:hypothetical protein
VRVTANPPVALLNATDIQNVTVGQDTPDSQHTEDRIAGSELVGLEVGRIVQRVPFQPSASVVTGMAGDQHGKTNFELGLPSQFVYDFLREFPFTARHNSLRYQLQAAACGKAAARSAQRALI